MAKKHDINMIADWASIGASLCCGTSDPAQRAQRAMDEKRKGLAPKARAEKYENLNCLINVPMPKFGNRYELLTIDDGYLNGDTPMK